MDSLKFSKNRGIYQADDSNNKMAKITEAEADKARKTLSGN